MGGNEDDKKREGKNEHKRETLSISLLAACPFAFCTFSLSSPSLFFQPPDPSQIPETQIAFTLHVTLDPDLTDNNPSVCTNSGTVAVP